MIKLQGCAPALTLVIIISGQVGELYAQERNLEEEKEQFSNSASVHLQEIVSDCSKEAEEAKQKKSEFPKCTRERFVEVGSENLCGFSFRSTSVDTVALDKLMSNCLPKFIFGNLQYFESPFVVKRYVLESIGRKEPVSNEVISFQYEVKVCQESNSLVSGILTISTDEAFAYFITGLPQPCTLE